MFMYYNFNDMSTFIPQGICEVKSKYFITMYDSKHKLNSKVRIYDKNFNKYKDIILDNFNHLGGITYDKKRNKLWITIGNSLCRYDVNLFKKGIVKKEINFKIKDLINYKNQNSIAYVCYNNNKIYCGNFTIFNFQKPILISYDLDKFGNIIKSSKYTQKFYNKTQGITFFKNTMLVSTSFGRYFKSKLIINNKKYSMIPNMEQIVINDKNELVILSEYNYKSFNKNSNINDITIIKDVNSFF